MGNHHHNSKLTAAGLLITLGIVFGDIGTSPLYVLNAIIGKREISEALILGSISAIFWTLTFQTTLKYVVLTLRADNNGEGGILSLYALVRRRAKWLVIPAIIGGSTLLADGIITPPISVTSAIEGLKILKWDFDIAPWIVPIVIIIIFLLFVVQQYGTELVGKIFGPVMMVWFASLAFIGLYNIQLHPSVVKALNPYYAYQFIVNYPGGFWLLGSVFLCTTGAEALYSDLGHCGRKNIQISWIFVKISLILNYFGQGAWLIAEKVGTANPTTDGIAPFYAVVPDWLLIPEIIIATFATIIASQALISGSYTLINEAMRLNLWPKVRVIFPTVQKGQVYIPSLNWLLCAGCIGVVLYFRESSAMEGAYGLAITLTMMMTTLLLTYYMRTMKFPKFVVVLSGIVFLTIEIAFLVANLEKLPNGGFVTLMISYVLFLTMWIWYQARKIKNRYIDFVPLDKHLERIKELSNDETIPKYATNLVYLTSANYPNELENKIIYSIFNKQPKRADTYWFLHVNVVDDPYTKEYQLKVLEPGKIFKIDFNLGFRVAPKVNLFFRKVVEELDNNNEVDITSRYESLRKYNITGDFKFVVIERILNYDFKLPAYEQFLMSGYAFLKTLGVSEEKAFGLDTSSVTTEKVPLIPPRFENIDLARVD